jgi:hypothetical protein
MLLTVDTVLSVLSVWWSGVASGMATVVLLDYRRGAGGVVAALPGAAETVGWLAERRTAFLLVTNTSLRSRGQIAELLADAGVEVDVSAILTAARYFAERYRGAGSLVVNEGPSRGGGRAVSG